MRQDTIIYVIIGLLFIVIVVCFSIAISKAHGDTSPVMKVAQKALAGEFGELADWQQNAYNFALVQETDIKGLAWVTHYTPDEGFYRGKAVRWGQGCSERIAAAIMIDRAWYKGLRLGQRSRTGLDMSRDVWVGDYVLIKLSTGWEMRQVLDTGAMYNLPAARSKGCRIWLDRWTDDESLRNVTWNCPYTVIRAYRTW